MRMLFPTISSPGKHLQPSHHPLCTLEKISGLLTLTRAGVWGARGAIEGLPGSTVRGSSPTNLSPQPLHGPRAIRAPSPGGLIPWEPVPPPRSREKSFGFPKERGAGHRGCLSPLTPQRPSKNFHGAQNPPPQRDGAQRVTPTYPACQNPPPCLGKPRAGIPGWVNMSSHSFGHQNQNLGLGSAVTSPGEGLAA